MADINFQIPVVVNDLLEENCEHYYVKEVVNVKRLPVKLKEAKQLLKEEGVEYIVTYFDVYISVILNVMQLSREVQVNAFKDLHSAMMELNRSVTFLLSDKDLLTEEVKLKYLNIIKMLMYAYINTTITVNNKDPSNTAYKKGKQTNETSIVPKNDVLLEINKMIQQEICSFWDSPVVEETLINQIAEVCYNFIESNSAIKSDKELCQNMFHIFGILLTDYRYGTRFVYRIAEVVKSHEHAVPIVSEGIKLLVESFNAKGLVREFVKQITEWQTDEKYQNAQATKNCAHVLSEMAKIMPEFMLEEVLYLTEYLNNESYTLRLSVINVITEVILTCFSKPTLSTEELESRNEFFEILFDHMMDVSSFVRARVIQNWSRLQKENILPAKMQAEILQKTMEHLKDKASNVRKAAANCVTSFLEHNPFGSELKLKKMEEILTKEKSTYEEMMQKHCEPHFQKLKESEEAWNNMKDDLAKFIENNLNEDNSDNDDEEFNIPKEQIPGIVRTYLQEKKYDEAFKTTKRAVECIEGFSTLRDTIEHANEGEFLLKIIHNFYFDVYNQLLTLTNKDSESSTHLSKQQELVSYYEDAVKFLKVLESAIEPMRDLLESVNISEMHEAVDFFVATYKFDIDNALQGILEMLRIMQRPEQDRKVAVTNALKAIFLETNASSMLEHRTVIVGRLISFMESVTFDKVNSFKLVVHNWVSEGKLDNNITECVFQYFTKKQDVTDDISLKALQLLTLIAPAKKTIVSKNLYMISELIFEKRGVDNMVLFSETCKLLTAGTTEHQLITDTKPPFKLKPTDPVWGHIVNILCKHFDNSNMPHYNSAVKNAIRLIYTLCSKPDEICETIINTVSEKIAEVAICQLTFLDETVYKEIKRRLRVTVEKASTKSKNKRNVQDFSSASWSRKNAATSTSTFLTEDGDESVLEGAQADDSEADFILNVLENKIVTSPISLGAYAPIVIRICENPDKYDDECLQCVAVLCLLRYMLVSSKFCASNIRLVFTILEKTKYSEVKCIIVINLGDLLERFPNIIEPWSLHIYNRLNDKDLKVQKTTFYILANLLLRDMLRVKSHIAFMAVFISETNNDLSNMSKNFFHALSVKDNHLYNVLPDIFSHLVTVKDINEDQFRFIMKYLVNLITSTKHTENLVDRFCIKFNGTEDAYVCRNIAYALSLLQYNEKAIKKFLENFNSYKHILHNSDVYALIKQTMNSWNKLVKTDIKAIVEELEDKINSVFQVTENGGNNQNEEVAPTRSVKKLKSKPVRKNKKWIQSRDSESDDEEFNTTTVSTPAAVRTSTRSRRGSRRSPNE
ncbi:hypothetical protein Trydic_g1193 [Trypoxylus dichotomus]